MPAFVISVLLERLRRTAPGRQLGHTKSTDSGTSGRRHRRGAATSCRDGSEETADPRQTGGGKHLLQQIVPILQEGRDLGIGVMVVDQSPPQSLANAVLRTRTRSSSTGWSTAKTPASSGDSSA